MTKDKMPYDIWATHNWDLEHTHTSAFKEPRASNVPQTQYTNTEQLIDELRGMMIDYGPNLSLDPEERVYNQALEDVIKKLEER